MRLDRNPTCRVVLQRTAHNLASRRKAKAARSLGVLPPPNLKT
jgi:hypothetical protein